MIVVLRAVSNGPCINAFPPLRPVLETEDDVIELRGCLQNELLCSRQNNE